MTGYASAMAAILGLPPPPEPTPRQKAYALAASVLYVVACVGLPMVCVPVFMWQAIYFDPQRFQAAVYWWAFGGLAAFISLIGAAMTLAEMSIPKEPPKPKVVSVTDITVPAWLEAGAAQEVRQLARRGGK